MKAPTSFSSWRRSLQIELERQLDHTWRHLTGAPTLRHSLVTPQLFLGGQFSRRGWRTLQKRGITAVVNMRTTQRFDPAFFKNVQYLHLPTPDRTAPTMANLKRGVHFIEQEVKQGGKVFIHCAHGEGRGPSMIIAYLISTGITFEDALQQVQKVRSFARPTSVQIKRLKEFENWLQNQAKT